MSTPQSDQNTSKEGRILLAIRAFRNGQFSSIRAAARAYDVPRSTLTTRLQGRTARADSTPNNQKLTPTEESTLVEWILSMDQRGLPLQATTVRQMANLLLAERSKSTSTTLSTVGKCWVRNFINRHKELQSKYNRKYDYQRAQCEDPKIIHGWFQRVRDVIQQYGVVDQDIYNFDETGFQMGVISTAKVITGSDQSSSRARFIQPGNREWVTVIESINSTGWALPPMIIFAGKMHQSSWYRDIPSDWVIGVSENGWTNDQLGLL